MAIATSTALLLGGMAASGAAKAIAAKKAGTAAKKAAEEQAKATQQASGYNREALGQIGQLYSPFLRSGAANTLNRLTTPGPGATYASPGAPTGPPPPGPVMGGGGSPGMAMPRGGMPPQGGGYGGTFDQMYQPPVRPRMPPPGQFQY